MGFKRLILAVIIIIPFFFPSYGFTEAKDIIAEGTYNMGDGETPTVAESRALLQAKRLALEQAGTYVRSYTKVKNLQLTEDEIEVMTSGIMELEILEKERSVISDGIHFWVKIKARINLDKTEEMAKLVKEKSVIEDYKRIQEAYDRSQKEIEDYSKAIALKPEYAEAYYNRGVAYGEKGQHDRAIEDFNRAIALKPDLAEAYAGRGLAYFLLGNSGRAIADFQKACDMGNEKGCKALQMALEKK